MSDTIRLSTADGTEAYEMPAGPLCQWMLACRRPAVQIRKGPTAHSGPHTPLPVCEGHTERVDLFIAPVDPPFAVDVPDVGRVVVAVGAAEHAGGPRAFRVYVADVIAVEAVALPSGAPVDLAAVAAVLRWVTEDITYAGESWTAPMRAWVAGQS